MYFLVYASSAVKLFEKDELLDLLTKIRRNNASHDITGMLLYKEGNIMQVLEGEEKTVLNLFAKICRDTRHRGVLMLLHGNLPERQFPEWTMAFREMTSSDVSATPGFDPFLNNPLTNQEFATSPTAVKQLLLMFKKLM